MFSDNDECTEFADSSAYDDAGDPGTQLRTKVSNDRHEMQKEWKEAPNDGMTTNKRVLSRIGFEW